MCRTVLLPTDLKHIQEENAFVGLLVSVAAFETTTVGLQLNCDTLRFYTELLAELSVQISGSSPMSICRKEHYYQSSFSFAP